MRSLIGVRVTLALPMPVEEPVSPAEEASAPTQDPPAAKAGTPAGLGRADDVGRRGRRIRQISARSLASASAASPPAASSIAWINARTWSSAGHDAILM